MTFGSHEYQIGKLLPFDQFHVSRKIAPVIPMIAPMLSEFAASGLADKVVAIAEDPDTDGDAGDDKPKPESLLKDLDLKKLADSAKPFFDALAAMPEDDANYVMTKCLAVVQRRPIEGGMWGKVCPNKTVMFDDMDLSVMLPLVIAVLRVNLGAFIGGLAISPLKQTS